MKITTCLQGLRSLGHIVLSEAVIPGYQTVERVVEKVWFGQCRCGSERRFAGPVLWQG